MEQHGFRQRWESYRASKTVVFWACVAGAGATVIIGFNWGGWVRGSTAQEMAATAASGARAELAATICVNHFVNGPGMPAKLASLKLLDPWDRGTFIQKGGWATVPGVAEPVNGAAALCAEHLVEAKQPMTKAAGTSG
jgi:hypothetical protein